MTAAGGRTPRRLLALRAPLVVPVFVLLAVLGLAGPAAAGGLRVVEAAFVEGEAGPAVTFGISWDDAWRTERNHDAAWVVVKLRHPEMRWWVHAKLRAAGAGDDSGVEGAAGVGAVPMASLVPDDRVGAFLFAAEATRGRVAWHVTLPLDPESLGPLEPDRTVEASVIGHEMVHVPEGPFWLGDEHPDALLYGGFFRAGEDGAPDGLYEVTSEDEIDIGPEEGALHYQVHERPEYEGDQRGPLPEAFPKGFAGFHVMKYELSQGDYARFLEHLPDGATAFRANFGGRGYERDGGSIRREDERFVAAEPGRALNFVSWDDGCAYLDWVGLRPMTELEFTKACRGGDRPAQRSYPWGTASKERLLRVTGADWELARDEEADESRLADDTLEVLGASRLWVFDLAGSVWERVVTVGQPEGRAFTGEHGDGVISWYGDADVPGWPRGEDQAPGCGYRGGGWYGPEMAYEPDGFNPHSPVAFRRFGAWGQGPRSVAYGFRGVRSDP